MVWHSGLLAGFKEILDTTGKKKSIISGMYGRWKDFVRMGNDCGGSVSDCGDTAGKRDCLDRD